MKAMIFAAGLGTRLKDFTKDRPKALVEVGGYPLLDAQIRKMYAFGIREIVVNVHHFAEKVVDFLENYPNKNIRFYISDESDLLLDTGGGLKNAAEFFSVKDKVLLHNVDVLSDLDFQKLESDFFGDFMMIVKERKSARKLLFDEEMRLCGWRNKDTGHEIMVVGAQKEAFEFSYSGIAVASGDFIGHLPGEDAFPLVPSLLKAAETYDITGKLIPHQWIDVGKLHELQIAEDHLNTYFKRWLI